jgi:serine/threonine protein phosphatase 1
MSSHLFTYAIGDIYGDHALLTTLLDRIHDHADGEDYRLVFLGNTIDHGPNGAAVLSALRSMELRAPDRVVTLRGWHEAMMAEARGDAEAFATWMRNGGDTTLNSFGVHRHAELPREVVDWIARRPSEFRDGLRRFVSDAALAQDQPDATAANLHLVHGSSRTRAPGQEGLPIEQVGRTDIDTGAGFGGCLTAALFTDMQASPAGFFQAMTDGSTRFLAPLRSVAQPWDPRLAMRLAEGEPETASAWSLRQDADLVAARMAQKKREGRRRTALAAAAGLVVVVGGTGVLMRPAMTFLARSMAPTDTQRETASSSAPAPVVAAPTDPAPRTRVQIPPDPAPGAEPSSDAATMTAEPPAAAEGALRTHALPASGQDGQAVQDPSSTASMSPITDSAVAGAADPSVGLAGAAGTGDVGSSSSAATLRPAPPVEVIAPGSRAAVASASAIDAPALPAGTAVPARPVLPASQALPAVPALPALAMADGIAGTASADASGAGGTVQDYMPLAARPEFATLTPFALALDPSRRVGWTAGTGGPDNGLARLGLTREASNGQPVLGPGLLSDDTVQAPAKAAVAKPKPRRKPHIGAQNPVRPIAPREQAGAAAADQGGPIDLRALMDSPRAARPRKRVAPLPAPAEPGLGATDGVGQQP